MAEALRLVGNRGELDRKQVHETGDLQPTTHQQLPLSLADLGVGGGLELLLSHSNWGLWGVVIQGAGLGWAQWGGLKFPPSTVCTLPTPTL